MQSDRKELKNHEYLTIPGEIPAQFAHRGIGIVHPATAIEIGLKNGDVANLSGRRETGIRVRLSRDAARKSIHLDATERLNIGLTPLDNVEVKVYR